MVKSEVSYTTIIRGTEFMSGIAVNLLVSLHMTRVAVTVGITLVAIHTLASLLYCLYSFMNTKN
ncbi:hypothetical protein [Citrifermentans bremense]|uniref:hypothetical protein n=1 Tax=Citrifermentans bremense TaxID=60035 RepID=UPI0012EB6600|nr:hypothetical protein [Citrifermentans bremense]